MIWLGRLGRAPHGGARRGMVRWRPCRQQAERTAGRQTGSGWCSAPCANTQQLERRGEQAAAAHATPCAADISSGPVMKKAESTAIATRRP